MCCETHSPTSIRSMGSTSAGLSRVTTGCPPDLLCHLLLCMIAFHARNRPLWARPGFGHYRAACGAPRSCSTQRDAAPPAAGLDWDRGRRAPHRLRVRLDHRPCAARRSFEFRSERRVDACTSTWPGATGRGPWVGQTVGGGTLRLDSDEVAVFFHHLQVRPSLLTLTARK